MASFGRCRSAVRKRPLLLPFPAERKRKGPRGPSAVQFLLSLSRQTKKAEVTQKSYEMVLSREVRLITFIVLPVSLTRLHSLCSMQRERSKRNTRGGMSPTPPAHGTSAAGSREARWNLFGEKASNSPPHGGSDKKPFRFPAARGNPLTSHVPSLAQCCLGLPSASTLTKARREKCIVVLLTGHATASCEKNMVPHKSLALPTACGSRSFLKAEAAPAESDCVAREGIFARRVKTNLPMCLKPRERLSLGRFAELFLTCLHLSAAEVPCRTAPFASFSGRAEKDGPARPERVPIS